MYTQTPIHLGVMQCVMPDDATGICQWLLPECHLESSSLLIEALCSALQVSEDYLHLDIKALLHRANTEHTEVIDEWLQQAATSRAQYMSKVVNRKSSMDGLFVWLAAVSQDCHVNIMHTRGVWTTHASELVVMTDASIVYIMCCFLSMPVLTKIPVLTQSMSSNFEIHLRLRRILSQFLVF